MEEPPKVYAYKKTVRVLIYGTSALISLLLLSRLLQDLRNGRDLASTVVTQLFLVIPVSAWIAVGKRFIVTEELLVRAYLFGRKTLHWTDVTQVMRKEGTLQEVLRVTDRRGQTIEIPFEQLEGGNELYHIVKTKTDHARWVSKVWFSAGDPNA